MNIYVVFLFAGIIILAALILFLMNFGRKCNKILDVEGYRAKCLSIEHQLIKDEPSSYQLSVLNADKLVDQAMREIGIKGQTMGERMRNSTIKFTDINGFWTAHKLRNKIAHESDTVVSYEEARYALNSFRKALKDLGAI
ncbi:MAG: hypothetical protein WA087_01970 [Candidatus Saccharimonadales bacterium]